MPITQESSGDVTEHPMSPISMLDDPSCYVDVVTADTNNTTPTPSSTESQTSATCSNQQIVSYRALLAPTQVRSRPSPLPVFPWADSREIWETMMAKEEFPGYRRDRWFARHPALTTR